MIKTLWNRVAPRRDPSLSLSDLQGQVAALHRAQAIIEFDLEGNILDANDNFLRTMGYPREEVVGQHHRMFVTPEERDGETYRAFWQRLGEGQHYTGQFERVAQGGRRVWIQGSYSPILDAAGRPRKIVKHATDVTAQRLKTADMEGRLAAIDRAQAVISFDLDGTILEANDNFLHVMGYGRDEVIGNHHRMFVDPRERASDEYTHFWERLRRGEYNAALYRRVRKDGADVWIQATYNPIFDMAGKPFKIVKYATDVTQQAVAMNMLQGALGSLAETVPVIAGDAQNANRLAHDASTSASSGGAMVDRLVETMGEIDRRAQSMAEIIAVMDSIAFQTTILAINAAVEAAHAGEQGRGFGVVAQEVRALSQRSAQSAKEIRELVQNTIESLGEGSERARQAGAAMHAIVDSAGQVNARVGQIADAAHAQAAGLVQVRQAIEQLRHNG